VINTLTEKEKKVLVNFLGGLNYYEVMALLNKQHQDKDEKELTELYDELSMVILKVMR
jgi:helix-turn-helix protein